MVQRAAERIYFSTLKNIWIFCFYLIPAIIQSKSEAQLESEDGERDSDFDGEGAKCGDSYCNLLQLMDFRAYSFSVDS